MEIFNMVRGHFALLIGRTFVTPTLQKEFSIVSVSQKEGDWQIELKISTGKHAKVYLSDVLRVYTHIVSSNRPLTQTEIDQYVNKNKVLITSGRISYILPLLATFTDIEITTEPEYSIRFIPLRENLS